MAVLRSVVSDDAEQIVEIYNPYIETSICTFEEEPVTAGEIRRRIATVTAEYPWLVAEEDGRILGYAYASKWRSRSAYRFALEGTVYVRSGCHGRGLGSTLYTALFRQLQATPAHAVIGVIGLPNDASVRLHERLGFFKAAHFPEVGRKFDRWVDVGYWQLLLDRFTPGT